MNNHFGEKPIMFVDLDGTVTGAAINNTYDFLRNYFYEYDRKGIVRYHFANLVSIFAFKLFRNMVVSRRVFLTLCTIGLKKSRLNEYATRHWLKFIKNHMNSFVLELIRRLEKLGYSPIMLTSCIEIPSSQIATFLAFERCTATTFKTSKDMIVGISTDTFGQLKFNIAAKEYGSHFLKHCVYIADIDSVKVENPCRLFKEVYLVKPSKIEKMS